MAESDGVGCGSCICPSFFVRSSPIRGALAVHPRTPLYARRCGTGPDQQTRQSQTTSAPWPSHVSFPLTQTKRRRVEKCPLLSHLGHRTLIGILSS